MRPDLALMSCDLIGSQSVVRMRLFQLHLPTTVNIELAAYAHHMMAKLVRMYPNSPSRGMAIPSIATSTSGNKQYPRTDAERGYVREEFQCELWD